MPLARSVHNAIATFVRSASVAAFGAEVLAFSVAVGPLGRATSRRLDLSPLFWEGLDVEVGALALGTLVAGLALSGFRHARGDPTWKKTEGSVMLSLATIVLLIFAPAAQG